ncbi:hypothetical protein CEXT_281821, partial [Caerostris extrusa]
SESNHKFYREIIPETCGLKFKMWRNVIASNGVLKSTTSPSCVKSQMHSSSSTTSSDTSEISE